MEERSAIGQKLSSALSATVTTEGGNRILCTTKARTCTCTRRACFSEVPADLRSSCRAACINTTSSSRCRLWSRRRSKERMATFVIESRLNSTFLGASIRSTNCSSLSREKTTWTISQNSKFRVAMKILKLFVAVSVSQSRWSRQSRFRSEDSFLVKTFQWRSTMSIRVMLMWSERKFVCVRSRDSTGLCHVSCLNCWKINLWPS